MKKIKAVLTDTSLFRRSYVICLFLCATSPFLVFAFAALAVIFLWGVFVLIYNEVKRRTALRVRFGLWLILFVISSAITALIHISPNFIDNAHNIVMLLHASFCFFLFYGVHTEKHLNFRRELYSVCRFIVYSMTVMGIIGLACLMANIKFEIMGILFIVHENRFAGLFANPNQLGYYSVAAMFCSHMLLKKDFIAISGRERVSTIWIASSFAVNGIALLLSDSNGAMLLAMGYIVIYLVYKMFGSERKFTMRQIVTKSVAALLAGVVIVGSLYFVRNVTQMGFAELMKEKKPVVLIEGDIYLQEEGIITYEEGVTFEHENKNIDSGRFKLWEQAWQMYLKHPVMGIGKGNVYEMGNQLFEKGVKFSERYGMLAPLLTDFHNGYLTIMVCSGAVGFLLIAIFGIRFYWRMTVNVFRREGLKESAMPCMYAFLCAYLGYAMIEEALLYNIMFTVAFFWLIMGYASCYLTRFEPDHGFGRFRLFGRSFRKTLL